MATEENLVLADQDHSPEMRLQDTFNDGAALVNILQVDIDDPTLLNEDNDLDSKQSSRSPKKGRGVLARRLNSPRTLEAMASLGLTTEELEPIPYESVIQYFMKRERKKNIPKELVDLRWNMINKRRHAKKEMIIREREKIIFQEEDLRERGGSMMGAKPYMTVNSSVSNPMFNNNSNPAYPSQVGQTTNASNSQVMNSTMVNFLSSPQTAGENSAGSKFGSLTKSQVPVSPIRGNQQRQTTAQSGFPKFVQSQMQNTMRSSTYSVSGS